jgi:8-oxo-dGTP diphosphatase
VLEGQARDAVVDDPRIPVILADGTGDDTLTDQAHRSTDLTALVTADRGLQNRLPGAVHVLSPSAVLAWL